MSLRATASTLLLVAAAGLWNHRRRFVRARSISSLARPSITALSCLVDGCRRWHHQFLACTDHVDKRRAVVRKGTAQRSIQFRRMFPTTARLARSSTN